MYGLFPGGSVVKNSPTNVGDVGSIPQEDTLEEEMATHSSITWEIPWTEEPGGLYSPWGPQRVGHNLLTKQQQYMYAKVTFSIYPILSSAAGP